MKPMQHRPLGRTNITVSPLALGTMTFGAEVEEPTARSMVDLCLERGVNFIDTANVYNGGESETILGNVLAGRRDKVVLATKVGLKMGEGADERGLSRSAILKGIEGSLRRLRTDYVDLYYLHQPDYTIHLEESLRTLDALVRSGKVRYIAASNYAAWQLMHMLWVTEREDWQPIVAVQPMYNLLARGIEQELVPMCREFGLAVIPYNPLAGGLLTGKHQADRPLADSRFTRMPAYRDRYWHDANFTAIDQLTKIAAAEGRSLARLAIRWILSQPAVTSVILGASKLAHLQENLAAMGDPPLSTGSLAACDRLWTTLRGITPTYNR
jgi:aryl-alcohol dehydrogenase-like predicted oxidoreductase